MRKTIYWVSTSFAMCIMLVSGVLAVTHASPMMRALAHLGYPVYFANLLGIGKLIGVAVLLAPASPRLKEWAYTAFAITVVSACYSHLCAGDGFLALDPLATLAALSISYRLRPENQKLENPTRPTPQQRQQVRSTISIEETAPIQR